MRLRSSKRFSRGLALYSGLLSGTYAILALSFLVPFLLLSRDVGWTVVLFAIPWMAFPLGMAISVWHLSYRAFRLSRGFVIFSSLIAVLAIFPAFGYGPSVKVPSLGWLVFGLTTVEVYLAALGWGLKHFDGEVKGL
jgi:hypothetical protein